MGMKHVPTRFGHPRECSQRPGIRCSRPWKGDHRDPQALGFDGKPRSFQRRHGLPDARYLDERLDEEANLVARSPPLLAGLHVKNTNGGSVFHSGGKVCLCYRAGQR